MLLGFFVFPIIKSWREVEEEKKTEEPGLVTVMGFTKRERPKGGREQRGKMKELENFLGTTLPAENLCTAWLAENSHTKVQRKLTRTVVHGLSSIVPRGQ